MFERFLGRKAADIAPPPQRQNPVRALVSSFLNFNVPRSAVSHENAMAAKMAMQHPITYRCIDKIGTSVQPIEWFVERDPFASRSAQAAYSEEKASSIEQVLRRPFSGFSGAQLRYWLAITWACYGRCTLKVSVLGNGDVNGIFPLNESAVKTRVNKSGTVDEIVYGNGSEKQTMKTLDSARKGANGRPVESYAVQIYKPNLGAMFQLDESNTPLRAIGTPAEIFNLLLQRAKETAEGASTARVIISSDTPMSTKTADEFEEGLDERELGGEKSGNILTLSGMNINVTELKNDLSDIHSKIPLDDASRMIAGNFGIPVALLGFASADGGKFANNFIESRRSFYEDTIIPGYCSPIEDGLSLGICPPGYRIRFDRDSIPALAEARAAQASAWDKVEFLTEDEKRSVTGWPQRGNDSGN